MPTKKSKEEELENPTKNSNVKSSSKSTKKPDKKTSTKKVAKKKTSTKKVAEKKTSTKKVAEKKISLEKVAEKKISTKKVADNNSLQNDFTSSVDITNDKSKNEDDFNWNEYEEGIQTIDSKQIEEFDKLINENFVDTYDDNVITGEVLNITEREAIIDINAKSEGVISLNEFRYNPDLKVGDKVEVIVDIQEDKTGQLVLSHRKARTIKAWERVIDAHEKETVVTGFVKCRTKGGMIVDVFGLEAFLPGSQIDVKPIRDYDQYVDKNMEFRVVKINHEFKNVVVSHKALIEADLEEQKKEIISQLEKGQVLEGIVKNITTYGVFVDLGGVDGLIHITDLSWNRINHPSEILDLDQKLNVVILDFDDDKSRIQLGVKQLSKHPWENLDSSINEGDKIKGKVSVIADYGAFIEVVDGVEGLVHVSEMSWSTHLRSAQDFVQVGDEVEAVVLTLDRESRKMSLGIKQLTNDPWTDITSKYPVKSKHKGKIRNFTNFGVFVELEEGIDGLIYISDLSWTQKIKHPSELFSISDEIEVIVLELDVNERKLSLGYKQMTINPWDKYLKTYAVDSTHELSINSIGDKGAIINLSDELSAIVPKKHMFKEDGSVLKEGDKVNFKVLECNSEFKRIVMSHTSTYKSDRIEIPKKNNKKERMDKSTLGDIVALADLKKQFEDDEKNKK